MLNTEYVGCRLLQACVQIKPKFNSAQLSVGAVAVIDTDADADDATDSTVAAFASVATFATFPSFVILATFDTFATFASFASFASFADGDHDVWSHFDFA